MPSKDSEIDRLRHLIAGRGGRQDNHRNRHFLREWRIYRGLSRYELAERLDTPIWVVAEWEAGERGLARRISSSCLAYCGSCPSSCSSDPPEGQSWMDWS
jgi:predicted transcriptional regulator